MKFGSIIAVLGSLLAFPSVCTANVVVYRNGVDGVFQWLSLHNACWSGATTYLNISEPLSQTGASSSRSLAVSSACNLQFGCESMVSYIAPAGADVEIAGGGTGSYYTCNGWHTDTNCPLAINYNISIDNTLSWHNSRQDTGFQGQYSGSFVGRFIGIRVRLADGWHYGWVGGGPSPYSPTAYALESEPDTSIVTPPCRTDTNLDGVIDIDDYFTYVTWFAAGEYRARWSNPDDFRVDIFDYLDFLNDFIAGC